MEYCGISIVVHRNRTYDEVPIRKLNQDDDVSRLPVRNQRKESKEALTMSSSLEVSIEGHQVIDPAFLYELRTILDEFVNKRLSECKQGYNINVVSEPFGFGNGFICIERAGSCLNINQVSDGSSDTLVTLGVVQAKTLFAMLHKAIQCSDFQ